MRIFARLIGVALVLLLAVPLLSTTAWADDRRERFEDRRERFEEGSRGSFEERRERFEAQRREQAERPQGQREERAERPQSRKDRPQDRDTRREVRRPQRRASYDDRRRYYEARHEDYRRERRTYRPPVFHPHGHRIDSLPAIHLSLVLGSLTFFYSDGMYFRHHDHGYVVVAAPIGARVAYLPAGYISFYIGPSRYFFVNTAYYWWDPFYYEYVVVEKPAGAARAMKRGEDGSDELYVYPAQGQSDEQRRQDRFECHEWAVDETGFDPTLANPNSPGRADYRRALIACLEGRGYTVK